jgi:hypothetical protein
MTMMNYEQINYNNKKDKLQEEGFIYVGRIRGPLSARKQIYSRRKPGRWNELGKLTRTL